MQIIHEFIIYLRWRPHLVVWLIYFFIIYYCITVIIILFINMACVLGCLYDGMRVCVYRVEYSFSNAMIWNYLLRIHHVAHKNININSCTNRYNFLINSQSIDSSHLIYFNFLKFFFFYNFVVSTKYCNFFQFIATSLKFFKKITNSMWRSVWAETALIICMYGVWYNILIDFYYNIFFFLILITF